MQQCTWEEGGARASKVAGEGRTGACVGPHENGTERVGFAVWLALCHVSLRGFKARSHQEAPLQPLRMSVHTPTAWIPQLPPYSPETHQGKSN